MSTQIPSRRASETTTSELVELLERDGRVSLEVEMAGMSTEVTLRKRDGTYYCDTFIKLLTYDDPDDLASCLGRLGVPSE